MGRKRGKEKEKKIIIWLLKLGVLGVANIYKRWLLQQYCRPRMVCTFAIPEVTTTITQPDPDGEGRDSWEEWGVDKIDADAVNGCSSLASGVIPGSVASFLSLQLISKC